MIQTGVEPTVENGEHRPSGRGSELGFKGLQSAHFEAYQEAKWSSNRFNLERMRSREVLEELVREVLEALGSEAENLGLSATQDHPTIFNNKVVDAQWVLLGRGSEERKQIEALSIHERSKVAAPSDPAAHRQQVGLSFRLDAVGLEIALRLNKHACLDAANLRARLGQDGGLEALLSHLKELPADLIVTVGERNGALEELLAESDAFASAGSGADDWFVVGRQLLRDDEALASEGAVEAATTTARALLPLYRFIAWSAVNDHIEGAACLAAAAERVEEPTPESTSEPAPAAAVSVTDGEPSARPVASKTTLRGGWSYRPQWKYEPGEDKRSESHPQTPSARARQRASEAANGATGWNYAGPRRSSPTRPEPEQRENPNAGPPRGRDDRNRGGPPRDRREGDRSGGRGDRPRAQRGGNERNDRSRPSGGGGDRRRDGGRGQDRGSRGRGNGRRDGGFGGRDRGSRGPKGPIEIGGGRKEVNWVESSGPVVLKDSIRVSGGLFNGRVGTVIELTAKGNFKVVVGDMVFEVKKADATRLEEG